MCLCQIMEHMPDGLGKQTKVSSQDNTHVLLDDVSYNSLLPH